MLPGISTACFYPDETEHAMKQLAAHNVAATEVFFNAFSELEDSFLHSLANMANSGNTKILSIHPFTSGFEPLLLFSNYRRRTLDGFELYKKYFNAANILGAKIIVIHGDYRGHNHPRNAYFDVFGELMEQAKHMGVMIAQENVARCVSYMPDFFEDMSKYLPDAKFVLDTKQCIRAAIPIYQMAKAMGNRICHVHISDHNDIQDCLPVGIGNFDVTIFLRTLRTEYDFDGGIVQELYRDNYGIIDELFDGYYALRRCVAIAKG